MQPDDAPDSLSKAGQPTTKSLTGKDTYQDVRRIGVQSGTDDHLGETGQLTARNEAGKDEGFGEGETRKGGEKSCESSCNRQLWMPRSYWSQIRTPPKLDI